MEKLIYMAILTIPILGIGLGFIAGAIGNLFGFGFWLPAIIVGVGAAMFQAGRVFNAT